MKQLQKSDLKVSEIYKLKACNREYLYRISDMRTSMTLCNDGYLIIDTNHFNKISNISQSHDFADAKYIETKQKYEFYNATPEEKHWLETCIKADKFISYEDAMKTFIPEYVECTQDQYQSSYKVGIIYKLKNTLIENETGGMAYWAYNQHRFKPSTKEAYDAQFVAKEPEFVLEEPKDKVLTLSSNYGKESIVKVQCSEGGVYKIGDKIKVFDKYSPNKGKMFTIQSFRWSNDKSKICAVTELHTPNGIGLDKIELYVEPKVKDNFILPEKWCVEVNEELRNRFDYHEAYGYHHSIQINDTNKWSNKIKKGFIEITFEQFKKYVLKDE